MVRDGSNRLQQSNAMEALSSLQCKALRGRAQMPKHNAYAYAWNAKSRVDNACHHAIHLLLVIASPPAR